MKRGDIVTIATGGQFGKPRPAVVVQSDFLEGGDTVMVCLITSTLQGEGPRRFPIAEDRTNGLRRASEIMVDKVMSVRHDRIGQQVGRLHEALLLKLNGRLALALGLADPPA